MKHFIALVQKDADSAYGVQFPDIPGVYSAADDAENIIQNAIEALQLYAEDAEMPAPSNPESVAAREDIRSELANGAYLISVPFIENDAAIVRVNVTMERGILNAIDTVAKERGLSRSAFLAQAARHEINTGA